MPLAEAIALSDWERFWLKAAFERKAKQFQEEGYSEISSQDVEAYFTTYAWKKEKPKRIRQKRQAVNALTANDYFDYAYLEASTLSVPKLDDMDISNLL
ncbi:MULTISPECIES: post-transcriptional regulator [Aerococcus]|uniref:Post-transcriptional regulator n=1 Tax=Aerococcus sanguinicola TaxID=119206 RepID=A0A5N1GMD1_9LACT|nr:MULTISPECIES: post-transcriptional regulator [Aerococcus]KAA9302135.1 hypothetical protein F6I03_02685 [Aerococcus sanguinicola]MDK6368435.1 post-transcriptional regulator [Aerococcus sp. UMB9870]MDK6679518.1 post-transcriptional regulator [Aerococcus sp. UMB8608]MDK6686362.1 post-transcriptional regulator [Aerococcus sp. UMB8623]MDK6941016.1 post-transcriptional regulator [Aerococcus sp. UMB8487]